MISRLLAVSACSLTLVCLYVAIPYLALFAVLLEVGSRGGVSPLLTAFALLFASSYLTQPEQYRLGLIMTLCSLGIFLLTGTPWILLATT